jgi:hypothetical protein
LTLVLHCGSRQGRRCRVRSGASSSSARITDREPKSPPAAGEPAGCFSGTLERLNLPYRNGLCPPPAHSISLTKSLRLPKHQSNARSCRVPSMKSHKTLITIILAAVALSTAATHSQEVGDYKKRIAPLRYWLWNNFFPVVLCLSPHL